VSAETRLRPAATDTRVALLSQRAERATRAVGKLCVLPGLLGSFVCYQGCWEALCATRAVGKLCVLPGLLGSFVCYQG
jgi:hypothetical protein